MALGDQSIIVPKPRAQNTRKGASSGDPKVNNTPKPLSTAPTYTLVE